MSKEFKRLETMLIHAGEPEPRFAGAVNVPIFQSSTFEYAGGGRYQDIKYIRLNNTPNHVVLHRRLAAIEHGEAALVSASGMATICSTLFAILSAGDHLLVQDNLYGGTHDLLTRDFAAFGLAYDFIDADDPCSWERHLRPSTKAIYVETISNPLMHVGDLQAVPAFAKAHGLISVIDNTFATPVNCTPLDWGYDLSLHSATKYLNGHSDIVAGAVIGSAEWIEKINLKLIHLGGSLDPHACFLLDRGMKTLAVRMRYHNESALRVARFLEEHPRIARVYYPGLESHARHQRARQLFAGYGGMLSFELKDGLAAAKSMMQRLRLPIVAPSLGGVETLITRPAVTSHSGLNPDDRRKLGISDALVRLSVGIEATEDLIEDLTQALA